jgi:c-di-GMP-binding flagellar brake protein YcgR
LLKQEVKTGMQVLVTRNQASPNNQDPYVTRVETVENDYNVLIHEPYAKGSRVQFERSGTYRLCFVSGGSQIIFNACFLENTRVERFNMARFKVVTPGEKVQRRGAYRFPCVIPVTFNIVEESGEQSELIKGEIRDLSAGGIKIVAKTFVPENALLRIDLQLNETCIMTFGVVRMSRQEPKALAYPYTYGIAFEAMLEKDEELIIRYIYNEQRKVVRRAMRRI